MKNLTFICACLLLITSCKKNNTLPGQSYHGAGGSYVNFSSIKWYITNDSGSTTLNLNIAGDTNADKLTMTTSGDGLISEVTILLKSGKFTQDTPVTFTHTVAITMQASTQVTVYKGSDKLVVPLESGVVNF